MEEVKSRRKFDKKAYLQTLFSLQEEFSRRYGTELSKGFDPRNWLKSEKVEAILVWPGDVRKEYESFLNGRCLSLDFWFRVYSKDKNEIYMFAIKYSPYKSYNSSILFFPSVYAHECPYTISWMTTLGSPPFYCKHVYAVLREIDNIAKKENLPIPKSFFYPRNKAIFYHFEKIEKDRKLTPEEKLEKTFSLLEEYLYLNELNKLAILNRRLKFLKKA